MEKEKRYEIETIEQLVNLSNVENYERLGIDFLLWLNYVNQTFDKYKKDNPNSKLPIVNKFIWIDDGKNEIKHVELRNTTNGEVTTHEVKNKITDEFTINRKYKMITKEQKEILLLIKKELVMNDGLRFNQVLHNLGINEFANKKDPYEKDFLLRDGYNDIDSVVLERIKNRKTIESKKETEEQVISDKKIILNRIKTPDGTVLTSHHVHDFVCHVDANGKRYCVDGGNDYLKRSFETADYEDVSIYSDAPFEIIRENFHRGGRGKLGNEDVKWTPMNEMSDRWLDNCIIYNEKGGQGDSLANKLYKQELEYRKNNNIKIED